MSDWVAAVERGAPSPLLDLPGRELEVGEAGGRQPSRVRLLEGRPRILTEWVDYAAHHCREVFAGLQLGLRGGPTPPS